MSDKTTPEYISKKEFDKIPDDYKTTVKDTIKTAPFRGEDETGVRKMYKDLGYDEEDPMIMSNENGKTVLKPVKVQEGKMSIEDIAKKVANKDREFINNVLGFTYNGKSKNLIDEIENVLAQMPDDELDNVVSNLNESKMSEIDIDVKNTLKQFEDFLKNEGYDDVDDDVVNEFFTNIFYNIDTEEELEAMNIAEKEIRHKYGLKENKLIQSLAKKLEDKSNIDAVYVPEKDVSVIFDEVTDDDGNAKSTEVTGFYYGSPDDELTKQYNGKLKATYNLGESKHEMPKLRHLCVGCDKDIGFSDKTFCDDCEKNLSDEEKKAAIKKVMGGMKITESRYEVYTQDDYDIDTLGETQDFTIIDNTTGDFYYDENGDSPVFYDEEEAQAYCDKLNNNEKVSDNTLDDEMLLSSKRLNVARELYNKNHKEDWSTLTSEEQANFFNRNYKKIDTLARETITESVDINKITENEKKTIKVKIYPEIGDTKIVEIPVDTSADIDEQIDSYLDKHEEFVDSYQIINESKKIEAEELSPKQIFIDYCKDKIKEIKPITVETEFGTVTADVLMVETIKGIENAYIVSPEELDYDDDTLVVVNPETNEIELDTKMTTPDGEASEMTFTYITPEFYNYILEYWDDLFMDDAISLDILTSKQAEKVEKELKLPNGFKYNTNARGGGLDVEIYDVDNYNNKATTTTMKGTEYVQEYFDIDGLWQVSIIDENGKFVDYEYVTGWQKAVELLQKQKKTPTTESKELKHPELNNNIKDFYTSTYKDDDLGNQITNTVTFQQLYRALKDKVDIYEVIGTNDSTVRERLFKELARILNTDYDYVYNMWQNGAVDGQPNVIKEDKSSEGIMSLDLNTGVLPLVDVDMYSLSEELNRYKTTIEELDEIVEELAPEYIENTLSEILSNVSVVVKGVYHPSQYNYSGDELEFTLNMSSSSYDSLKERTVNDDKFNRYLQDNYSSRSGFVSYLADNIDDFYRQDEWKQAVQVIMFNIPEDKIQQNNDNYKETFLDKVSMQFELEDETDELDESKKVTKSSKLKELNSRIEKFRDDYVTNNKKYNAKVVCDDVKKIIEDVYGVEIPDLIMKTSAENYNGSYQYKVSQNINKYLKEPLNTAITLSVDVKNNIVTDIYFDTETDLDFSGFEDDDRVDFTSNKDNSSEEKNNNIYVLVMDNNIYWEGTEKEFDADDDGAYSQAIQNAIDDGVEDAYDIDRSDFELMTKEEFEKELNNLDESKKVTENKDKWMEDYEELDGMIIGYLEDHNIKLSKEQQDKVLDDLAVSGILDVFDDFKSNDKIVDKTIESAIKKVTNNLDEKLLGPSDDVIADSKAKGLYTEAQEDKDLDVVNYNITDGGYKNNAETVYGTLTDGTYFVYYPEMDLVETYDCEPDELIDILYASEDEMPDEARTEAYNDFFEQHNVNTYTKGPLFNKLHKLYFDDDTTLDESNKIEKDGLDDLSHIIAGSTENNINKFLGAEQPKWLFLDTNSDELAKKIKTKLDNMTDDEIKIYVTNNFKEYLYLLENKKEIKEDINKEEVEQSVYETVFIIKGSLEETEAKKISDDIVENVFNGINMIKDEEYPIWVGKRELSYEIRKEKYGYYNLVSYKTDEDTARKVTDEIKAIDEIIKVVTMKLPEDN